MSVDASLVTPHLVDVAHDQQFVAERFEWFEDSGESLGLQWRRDTESEKEIEGSDRSLGCRSTLGRCLDHLFEQREGHGCCAGSTEHAAAADEVGGGIECHGLAWPGSGWALSGRY
jgi:hypothetical protein